jgi:hypothetical protein
MFDRDVHRPIATEDWRIMLFYRAARLDSESDRHCVKPMSLVLSCWLVCLGSVGALERASFGVLGPEFSVFGFVGLLAGMRGNAVV